MMDEMIQEGGNGELVESLTECLSNSIVYALKAHGHHWNVMGPQFGEFHDFFGGLYEDVDGAVDTLAELIRQRGGKTPYRLVEFAKNTEIADSEVGSDPIAMLHDVLEANRVMVDCLNETFAAATLCNDQGICNFIADRLGAHSKWNWKISAYLGQEAIPSTGTYVETGEPDEQIAFPL